MTNTDDRPKKAAALLGVVESTWVDLDSIVERERFQFRELHEVSVLAESIIRHGQREPVDLRPIDSGMQVLAGHRRVAAIQMLGRKRVLARVHEKLSDEEAIYFALADDLDRRPWSNLEKSNLRSILEKDYKTIPAKVSALLDRSDAQARFLVQGETVECVDGEVDPDFLAGSVRDRLADACNDLSEVFEVWPELDEGRRADLIECVAYLKDMYPFLIATEKEQGEPKG